MKSLLSYLDSIDRNKDQVVPTLQKWAHINSGTHNLDGLASMHTVLKAAFKNLGGTATTLSLAPQTKVGALGETFAIPLGNVLSIVKRPEAPFKVFLGGHMDTVYPSDSPFQKTELLPNNIMRGPGVADMKGGLLIMLYALEALERSPFASKIGWEVFINPDEEIGSVSSIPLIQERAKNYKFGLIFEPSLPDGALVSSRKGSANMTIIAHGKAAHVGRDYFSGKNAIHAMGAMIQSLAQLNDQTGGTIVNVGRVYGGGPANVVPDFAILNLNMRAGTKEQMLKLKQEIESIVERTAEKDQVKITIHAEGIRAPKPFDAPTQALFEEVKKCGNALGIDIAWRETGGVCDGNTLAAAGVPTVDTLGVVGGNIHTVEEFVHLDSIIERAKLAALLLLKIAAEKGEMV